MPIGIGLRKGGAAFDITTLPGYLIDFDTTSGVTQAGGQVSAWVDKKSGITAAASGTAQGIYTANAQGTYPSIAGNGSTVWMPTGNINWASGTVIIYLVAQFVASANNAINFEFANNAAAGSGVKGFTCQYLTAGPGLQLTSGSSGGTATIRGTTHIFGTDPNTNFRVYCMTFDRTMTWPIITGVSVAPTTELYFNQNRIGESVVLASTGAFATYDTAPLNLFARTTNGTTGSSFSNVSILRLMGYNANHTFAQKRNAIAALQAQYGI